MYVYNRFTQSIRASFFVCMCIEIVCVQRGYILWNDLFPFTKMSINKLPSQVYVHHIVYVVCKCRYFSIRRKVDKKINKIKLIPFFLLRDHVL